MATELPFRIREARREDVSALAELHVVTFKETHGRFRAPSYELRESQWRAAFEKPQDWFAFVAESSNGFYEHLGAERLVSPKGEFHGGYGWRDIHSLVSPVDAK
jgi:hypothetical protein